ncbi:DNA alkylation repair protein [Flavobacterium sp. PLA-1-15]|uniref:DNA alkylation repair protein n=1 Tax=Flavobacterium sp. PLA-1-15 TaxID=3380533 RepID=UPI003B7D4910
MNFIKDLEKAFQEHSNRENAIPMENYMKKHFSFYGVTAINRRLIFKTVLKQHQKEVSENAREIAKELFSKKQRELHYCGIEILIKELKKKYKKEDISLIEFLIVNNSWWDSVDTISKYILGEYLMQFPEETDKVVDRFSNSENMWLNRSAILFQLGYKQKTNSDLLFALCQKHSDSDEFFIRKAIGWALREYGKTNSSAVIKFVEINNLKPLSKKEALKNIA